ncbi:MAG: hypothetical protein M1818_007649 [Claussenomyces sp. TS43310]|nr:MAG: hypothetical protein M1818_007649 [Claussenomyces sp. TS43310]
MAPNQAPIPVAPNNLAAKPSISVELTPTSTAKPADAGIPPLKSLKRNRVDQSPDTASLVVSSEISPLKSPRLGGSFASSFSPQPMTGAAALADERRKREEHQQQQQQQRGSSSTSENPGHKVLSSLISGDRSGMSRVLDAPPATTALSSAMSTVAHAITIPTSTPSEEKSAKSPASVTSLASLGSTAPTVTASTTAVASPSPAHGITSRDVSTTMPSENQSPTDDDQPSNRAFSYPGNVLAQADAVRGPARGMSLPMSGLNQQLAPRSPSHKKHKCQYCDTEFTRHHNLKSHLLTHSQEKPYVCSTCQMRFRRLHDLKRHTKLHTGERPHICPKCNRKFARGDALARHAKGQGGCAGRRASVGSFGGDDDYDGPHGDDGGMDGIMYAEPEQTNEEMSEEEARRFSLPSIKTQHVSGGPGGHEPFTSHPRGPSTYPPAGPRPPRQTTSLYPPSTDHGGSSSSTSPRSATGHSAATSISTVQSAGGVFSPNLMTESPKPLSPAGLSSQHPGHDPGHINRQRSPSLTTQFQQQHFGRRDSSRASPQMSLPSPHGPKLPALSALAPPGLVPPESRYTLQSQASANAGQPGQVGQPLQGNPTFQPPMSGPASGSGTARGGLSNATHLQSSGSGDSNNLFASGDRGLWTYVQNLEERVRSLSDRVLALEEVKHHHEIKIDQLHQELMVGRGQPGGQGPNHLAQRETVRGR